MLATLTVLSYKQTQSYSAREARLVEMIEKNSILIDLGCGNGSLLEKLIKEKNVQGQGIEISKSGVDICKKKGLNILEGKIDEELPFADNAFDYAICNVTIQMVMYPEILLKEMKRVARFQIISFPNFAYWHNRLDLLIHGRMPKPMLFGYEWYLTGHIHQLSVSDFEKTIREINFKILKRVALHHSKNSFIQLLAKLLPNVFSTESIYLLEK